MVQIIDKNRLIVSTSPHFRCEESTRHIIWSVVLALQPASFMSVYFFGPMAVAILTISIFSAVVCEYGYQKLLRKKVTIDDGSAVLTGLLLGLTLPPSVPMYIPVIGSFVAIVVAKQLFGGFGFNIFNPALIGRAFLQVSFPKLMTTWFEPTAWLESAATFFLVDAKTTATPLGVLKEEGLQRLLELSGNYMNLYTNLLFGNRAGSLGETSVVALALGAAFLLYRRYISWRIPISYLVTAGLLAWVFGGKDELFTGNPVIHLMTGGIILCAFFMATDYVTSPLEWRGQILFGVGCGFIAMLIRLKGGYPEGVMFSVLLMNCFTPLIDRSFRPKVFGTAEKRGPAS
jgi:Na+-translocating ferredoxin:NAD+ oxidoreductase subunit D